MTIKTIAQLANVSPSTVSIILNGKAKERKISSSTEMKVLKIAASSGYKANVQAINLRAARQKSDYHIIIFWTADFRATMMTRFFKKIESEILDKHYLCEILLKPYVNGSLSAVMTDDLIRSCHGVIVCNSSEDDLEFLENHHFSRPVVLYNRYSKKYSAVTMDDREIGMIPANILSSHNRKKPAIIASPATFNGMTLRTNLFSYQCIEHGMKVPWVYYGTSTLKSGYETTLTALKDHPDIDSFFYTSDTLAIGALRAFHELDIQIPKDIEFIAVGNNELEQSELCYPSISVVYLPIEAAAAQCLRTLYELMTYQKTDSASICIPVTYIARESCPDRV